MSQELYSVEQVASKLGLHVRTVRAYVREGKLKAVRIGKQYRIAADDLAAMTGRPVSSFETEPVPRHRHVDVSSIVEIDAISVDQSNRLTNLLLASAKGRGPTDDPLRIETIYNQERAQLKVILIGGLETCASILKAIKFILES